MIYKTSITNNSGEEIFNVPVFGYTIISSISKMLYSNNPHENPDLVFSEKIPPIDIAERLDIFNSIRLYCKESMSDQYCGFNIVAFNFRGEVTITPVTPRLMPDAGIDEAVSVSPNFLLAGNFQNLMLNRVSAKSTIDVEIELSQKQ